MNVMSTEILLDMLFEFLSKRKITASCLAEKYGVSERTVYRYVETLSHSLPLVVKRGRNGGICLSDSYRLPVGFMSKDEYTAILDALQIAYTHDPNPRFTNARKKLNTQVKTEQRDLSITGEASGFFVEETLPALTEKIRVLRDCAQEELLAEIEYLTPDGEIFSSKIEPHTFLLKEGIWCLYAFCHHHREFYLFSIGRIHALVKTDEPFRKRPFEWQDIPLTLQTKKRLTARLEIAKNAVEGICDKLGVENVKLRNGKWIAEVVLPEENAAQTILSLGAGVKILSPDNLREKVTTLAKNILKSNL
jgi:predicted DNA-binding transcriptional regulator YafY